MVVVLGMNTEPRRLMKRPPDEVPYSPGCKLQLQRICGTCTNYQGPLRPPGDDQQISRALCACFNVQRHRLARAWKCTKWARKVGGGANG